MTIRKMPELRVNARGADIDWDPPTAARDRWSPVRAAAHDDERTLNILGPIGESWDGTGITDRLVASVLRRMGAGPVTVNINSPGGDYFAGLAIYNQLREHDGAVTVNVVGIAASAASMVAMGSDTLRVARAGFLMIHNAWGVVIGNQNDMRDAADIFEQFDKAAASVYAVRSGNDRDQIQKWMDRDTFFSGEDAIEHGFADALLASDEIEDDDEPAAAAADRRFDLMLAKQGIPRSERRALLAEVKGTPRAARNGTPGAAAIAALMERQLESINER